MQHRTTVSRIALAAAALYAVAGAIELAHDQPTVFAGPIDYWIEIAFGGALVASAVTLAWLRGSSPASRAAAVGWVLAAVGHVILLVAVTATAVQGREALDPVFPIGVLAIVAGYLTLAVVDLRKRLVPSRAGLVLLVGFVVTAVLDNTLVLAAAWAALGRLISASEQPLPPDRRWTAATGSSARQ